MQFSKEKTLLFSFIFITICKAKFDNEKAEIMKSNNLSSDNQEGFSRKVMEFAQSAGDKNLQLLNKLNAVRSRTVKTDYRYRKDSVHFPAGRVRRASLELLRNESAVYSSRINRTQQPRLKNYCKFKVKSIALSYECRPLTSWGNEPRPVNYDSNGNNTNFPLFRMESRSTLGNDQFYVFNCSLMVTIMDALKQWNIPENVSTLRLHKQNIIALGEKGFFSLKSSLKHLRLDSNLISYISDKAFEGIENLVELDLSRNRIRSLPPYIFSDLIGLRTLKLSHNQIERIEERSFACLSSLSLLDLSDNVMTDMHERALAYVTDSRSFVVNLRRNRLTRPRSGWLLLHRTNNPTCSAAERHKPSTKRKEISNHTEYLLRTRILWGEENLWKCGCSSSGESLHFLKTLISLRYPSKESSTKNKGHSSTDILIGDFYKVRWDVTLPCQDLKENKEKIDLGFPLDVVVPVNQSCCLVPNKKAGKSSVDQSCRLINEWIEKNVPVDEKNTTEKAFALTNNQVTIIGIVIVVLFPVLLTLCPDCNQPKPSSLVKKKQTENKKAQNRKTDRSHFEKSTENKNKSKLKT